MTGSKIPPPNRRALHAISGGKTQRRDQTVEFDLTKGKEVVPTKTVAVGNVPPARDTEEMDIPIFVEPLDPFAALKTMTFVAGTLIRNESEARGPVYYEILSGYADMAGQELKTDDFIGIVEFVEVHAKTALRVRVYDFPEIAAAGNPALHIAVMGRLFAASAKSLNGSMRENAKLHERIDEYDVTLRERLDELKERFIAPLRLKLEMRNQEIGTLNEQIARLHKDREADLESMHLSLAGLEVLVGSQFVKEDEKRIAKLIAIVIKALETMSESENPAHALQAIKAIDELYTFKMGLPLELIKKRSAT